MTLRRRLPEPRLGLAMSGVGVGVRAGGGVGRCKWMGARRMMAMLIGSGQVAVAQSRSYHQRLMECRVRMRLRRVCLNCFMMSVMQIKRTG